MVRNTLIFRHILLKYTQIYVRFNRNLAVILRFTGFIFQSFFLPILAIKFPLKQMPTLEVDGKVICQSAAIYRYLANEFNLYGSSNVDHALVDQICETLSEILTEILKIVFSKDSPEEKVYLLFHENERGKKLVKKLLRYLNSL